LKRDMITTQTQANTFPNLGLNHQARVTLRPHQLGGC
jgi:hypothetical protein